MILKTKYLSLLLFFASWQGYAQGISFKDTIAAYNLHKIKINKTGMIVLGSWGLANIAGGGIGYFTTSHEETKYFSEMNAAWGVVNTCIAGFGLAAARRDMAAKLNYEESYHSYVANKRLFLINAGLDVVYIGTGVGLALYGQHAGKDQYLYTGFGKSVIIQGIFLLLFDNVMISAHQLDNSKWFRIMNEIRFTNSGVGFSHNF
jgi:hypothetical protein